MRFERGGDPLASFDLTPHRRVRDPGLYTVTRKWCSPVSTYSEPTARNPKPAVALHHHTRALSRVGASLGGSQQAALTSLSTLPLRPTVPG